MQNRIYITQNKQASTFHRLDYHLQGVVLPLTSRQHLLYHSTTHGLPLPIIRNNTKRNINFSNGMDGHTRIWLHITW